MRWQAARACGSFYKTILQTLSLLHNDSVLEKLGISFPPTTEAFVIEDNDLYWIESERRTLQSFSNFLCQLAAYRAWSQMQFTMMLPQALACVHHESFDVRQDGLDRLRSFIDAVLNTENAVYNDIPNPLPRRLKAKVQRLLQDISWTVLQLARECMATCQNCDFDCMNEELRLLTYLLFGRMANTKFFLEDVFNHVADVSRRHAKNHVMQRCLGSALDRDIFLCC